MPPSTTSEDSAAAAIPRRSSNVHAESRFEFSAAASSGERKWLARRGRVNAIGSATASTTKHAHSAGVVCAATEAPAATGASVGAAPAAANPPLPIPPSTSPMSGVPAACPTDTSRVSEANPEVNRDSGTSSVTIDCEAIVNHSWPSPITTCARPSRPRFGENTAPAVETTVRVRPTTSMPRAPRRSITRPEDTATNIGRNEKAAARMPICTADAPSSSAR